MEDVFPWWEVFIYIEVSVLNFKIWRGKLHFRICSGKLRVESGD